jgi:hypothetical protein
VHKGRCSQCGGRHHVRLPGRTARAFLAVGGPRNHATSEIDKISKRKIDRPARKRGMLFLTA